MTAKHLALPLIALLTLGACKSEQTVAQERAYINTQLPEGCVLHDLGEYNKIRQLVVITCEGRETTTTNSMWMKPQGKSSEYYQAAGVEVH